MIDIQYNATIMGGREISRSYLIWFFAEGERFLSIEPITPPQHNTTPRQKDLRKQIHKHEQPPAIYTENQQVAVF